MKKMFLVLVMLCATSAIMAMDENRGNSKYDELKKDVKTYEELILGVRQALANLDLSRNVTVVRGNARPIKPAQSVDNDPGILARKHAAYTIQLADAQQKLAQARREMQN